MSPVRVVVGIGYKLGAEDVARVARAYVMQLFVVWPGRIDVL